MEASSGPLRSRRCLSIRAHGRSPEPLSQSWLTTLGFYADAADTFWQDWVVSYDLGRQLALADKMEQSSSRFRIDWLNWSGESMSRWRG